MCSKHKGYNVHCVQTVGMSRLRMLDGQEINH